VYRRLYASVRERAAREGGVCGFRLYVERENEAAQRTYEALGMSETRYRMYEEELLSQGRLDVRAAGADAVAPQEGPRP
jgi:ribosomal protein S18 acetylase RimI-like enzyme